MNKRLAKFGKITIFAAALLVLLLALSSCSLFNKGGEDIIAPKLDINSPPKFARIKTDFFNYQTNKEEVYADSEEDIIMPVVSGEKVHVVIDYINPSHLKINKVVLTGTGAGEQYEVLSKNFIEGSDTNQTKFEFQINAESGLTKYTISKIYYNLNSQVLSMSLNQVLVDLTVNVSPEFTLKLDYQNYDARNPQKGAETKTIKLNYNQSLSDVIPSVSNQKIHENTPVKPGGWSFRGYFTQPGGKGMPVKSTANFYFWRNTTVYAYYERLYEFTVANATYEIPYVDENGATKNYAKFATITKKTTAGDSEAELEIFDTLADDSGVYPVVAIGDGALANTFTLRTLKLGRYVKTIGKDALSGSNLDKVEFHPQGVLEKIDNRAFNGTSKLVTLTLPETVKYLGDRCFDQSGWGKMIARGEVQASSKLVIYPSLTHIGNWCFVETSFTDVIFMPGVKFKADAVQDVNYTYTDTGGTVHTADSDYYLGWCLFKSCQYVKKFETLSDPGAANGLEYISDGMFDLFKHNDKSSVGLTNIILAEGLKKIGRAAFHYQKLLTSLTFPDSLEDLGGDNVIEGTEANYPGTKEKADFGAFAECSLVRTVTFGDDSQLKLLGAESFYNNRALKEFRIKSKVLEFYGDRPFQGCNDLNFVYFYNDSKGIVPQPLTNNKGGGIRRKNGVLTADLFYSSQSFKVFVNDNIVDEMRDSLIKGAGTVTKRNLPVYSESMIKDLGDGRLAVLNEVIIDVPGWSIGYYFSDEKVIVLPSHYEDMPIHHIGSYAFDIDVQKITLSGNIKEIAPQAFYNCKYLTEVNYGPDDPILGQVGRNVLQTIGKDAFFNTAITSFIGGENLKTIGEDAFYECSKLVWVDLKLCTNTNFKIEQRAFNKCVKLKYIRLPVSYKNMQDMTFANCTSLKYVILEFDDPQAGFFQGATISPFESCPMNYIEVYVPSEDARGKYNSLPSIPRQLSNRFYVNTGKPSPDPEDLLSTGT